MNPQPQRADREHATSPGRQHHGRRGAGVGVNSIPPDQAADVAWPTRRGVRAGLAEDGALGGSRAPMVRRSVETQRREVGLHLECDNCTKRLHGAPTGTSGGATIMWISMPAAREARASTTTGAIAKGNATATSTRKRVESPVPSATASRMTATMATEMPRHVGRRPRDAPTMPRVVFGECRVGRA